MKDVRRYQLIAVVAALLALTVAFVRPKPTNAPTNSGNTNTTSNVNVGDTNSTANTNAAANPDTNLFVTTDLPDIDPNLHFSIRLDESWAARYDEAQGAIIFFDPQGQAADETKVAVKYYESTDFTAPARMIGQPTGRTIDDHDAQSVVIQAASADWPWTTGQVTVADVQATGDIILRFLVSPDVTTARLDQLLDSIRLDDLAG